MTDENQPDRGRTPDPEGVRIIGAEEAKEALEREDVGPTIRDYLARI